MTYDSIMKCDIDIRRDLFTNTVLSGGSTMLPGMEARLSQEMTALAPAAVKVRLWLLRKGNILYGLEAQYYLHCLHFMKCGLPDMNTMSVDHPLYTEDASEDMMFCLIFFILFYE
eukprot:TRINITY_DN1603_c0_g1_i1.p1 TRINITY_DN1603_c0_g1~~TRINITY_DN1603_c0_g1_i1.p1  ORF type:complete len:115 (-),score=26.67 TRINITY_DN1603_c0_g1_i1:234-578(-)